MPDRTRPPDGPATPGTRQRVVVTAGHVDHGKSTLVRALTGMEPDRLAEERRRGLTLDLGYAWTRLEGSDAEGLDLAFVDVPGHERFISTMLAGAGAAPAALLVVAADDGWSRQSSEHRDVIDLLGIPTVAIVVSKADLVSSERLEEVVAAVRSACAHTMLAHAPLLEVDALSGRGLGDLRALLQRSLGGLPEPADTGRPRLWIDRSFAVTGAGTVVTGTLAGGPLAVGDVVHCLPGGTRARIRGMQSLGRTLERADPGWRVALNLAGVDHATLARGHAVVAGDGWRTTGAADLWVRVLPDQHLRPTGAWHLHVGSASTVIRVLPTAGALDGRPGRENTGAVRVLLGDPLPLVAGDRVVLREAGRRAVVAGGVVGDPAARVRPRGTSARAEHAARIERAAAGQPSERLGVLLELAGGHAPAPPLLADAGLSAGAPPPSGTVRLADHLVLVDEFDRLTAAVQGLGPGVHERSAVAAALHGQGADAPLEAVITSHLVDVGVLVRSGGGYALPEHVEEAVSAEEQRGRSLLEALDRSPWRPPDLDETAHALGMDRREVAALIQAGEVVRLGKVAFTRAAVQRAAEHLRAALGAATSFTASEAREAWDTTRRYAIPLLEHLDRTGVTEFDGQHRRFR